MGFSLGPSHNGGTLPSWNGTGLFLAAIAVLTGLGLTALTVFDLIVLAAVSAATATASVLVARRVRRGSGPARPTGDEPTAREQSAISWPDRPRHAEPAPRLRFNRGLSESS